MPLGSQTARPDFAVANHSTDAPEGRGSNMVARDKPEPAPRPSLDLAEETDRSVFDAAWERERTEAKARQREVRRTAFKAERTQEHAQAPSLAFNRRATRQAS